MGEHDEFSMADVSANRRIGFWWLHRAAQSVAVDAALAQMMGQGEEATSIPLNELLGLVQSADSALLSQAIASAFAGELPAAYEIRLHSGASLMMKLGLVASAGEPPLVVACCQAMPAHGQTPQDSTRDALTGLYSRQYFDLMLEREWRISMRERHALSLLFIDVAPDAEAAIQEKLLIRMGELLPAGVFRPADVAARYAQSRLALLLPRTGAEGAAVCRARCGSRYADFSAGWKTGGEHGSGLPDGICHSPGSGCFARAQRGRCSYGQASRRQPY